jgi:hypothetical protein
MARLILSHFPCVGLRRLKNYWPLRCRYFLDWSGSIERKRLSKLLVSGLETFGVFGPPSSPVFRSHGLSVDGVLCICSGIYRKVSKNRAKPLTRSYPAFPRS